MRPIPIACLLALALAAPCACKATSAAPRASEHALAPTARDIEAVPPEFMPAFAELERAVASGDDLTARRILMGIYSRAPQGRALSLAEAFERVLAGRAAVAELHLKLVARPESDPPGGAVNAPSGAANAPSGAASASNGAPSAPGAATDAALQPAPRVVARLVLVAENSSDVPIELRPGPATLTTTKTSVAPVPVPRIESASLGSQEERSETHPYTELKSLRADPGHSVEIELARFFIDVPENLLAVRLSFELELRSGVIVRDGRELPAMNVAVRGDEVTCWIHLRHPEWKATPESLEEFAVGTGTTAGDCALEIAVRMPPADRERALDRLASRERDIPRIRLEELVPALRWLTDDSTLGGDPDLWRAFLRARAARIPRERPALELPQAAPR
jgi:hypothetical protein